MKFPDFFKLRKKNEIRTQISSKQAADFFLKALEVQYLSDIARYAPNLTEFSDFTAAVRLLTAGENPLLPTYIDEEQETFLVDQIKELNYMFNYFVQNHALYQNDGSYHDFLSELGRLVKAKYCAINNQDFR